MVIKKTSLDNLPEGAMDGLPMKVTILPDNADPQSETRLPHTVEPSVVQFHDISNTATFFLTDGTEIVMREPRPKDFLLLEAWLKASTLEFVSDDIALLKLAAMSIIKYGTKGSIDFDDLFDNLPSIADVERFGEALKAFRSMDDYTASLRRRKALSDQIQS
jgi:hypothetical protein